MIDRKQIISFSFNFFLIFNHSRCYYCTDYFWDIRELGKHRRLHTNAEYKCELCQQIFGNQDMLYGHIHQIHRKKKSEKPKEKFTCEICSKDFATKWSIKSHMLQHTSKYTDKWHRTSSYKIMICSQKNLTLYAINADGNF